MDTSPCPVTNKVSIKTREEIVLYLKEQQALFPERTLRFYKCEFCESWHLSHKKDKLRMS